MNANKLLVTGSSGLIGSEVVDFFCCLGWEVHGIDNNMRADFFGVQGDTRWNQERLIHTHSGFRHHNLDIRDREKIRTLLETVHPSLIVHAAAQPSHDLAALRPFDDFEINAVGTLNLLEAARRVVPNVVFVHMSTNKVYGDKPNYIRLRETRSRWEYDDPIHLNGITEEFPIDQSKHSIFGASKVAADVMVQEYGRYFGLLTCCLRGGCLTGPNHAGVELHGFIHYLIKCNVEKRVYKIFGYKGKQVRDNIHASDVASFIYAYYQRPKCAGVYNIGGGRNNSISIIEAFERVQQLTGIPMKYEYTDKNREGDHICYISDLSKIGKEYPEWRITKSLDDIFHQIHSAIIKAPTRECN
jgi:CDP-paratose 2-epimerase